MTDRRTDGGFHNIHIAFFKRADNKKYLPIYKEVYSKRKEFAPNNNNDNNNNNSSAYIILFLYS